MKFSSVMVCPVVDLKHALSDSERDVLRKVLLEGIRGIDAMHDKRWRRAIGWLINSEPGEITDFYSMRTRSLPFHQRHMAIERRVFDHQDHFPPTTQGLRAFRNWVKVGACLARLDIDEGQPKWLPGSVSFDELSDDEFREFHEAAMDFLRTPLALKKLWPAVPASKRMEMFETVIAERQEEHT